LNFLGLQVYKLDFSVIDCLSPNWKTWLLIGGLLCFLAACAPAGPGAPNTSATETMQSTLPDTPTATLEATTQPTTMTPASSTPESTIPPTAAATMPPAETATATLTPWEEVQADVRSLRNRLDSASDGYTGLSLALDQPQPNEAWCAGLNAGLNDFNYAKDLDSAARLEKLLQEQGCP
jgi:hypothetical protein